MWKPIVSKQPIEGKYVCKHATFWASVYGLVDRIIIERVRDKYTSELSELIKCIDDHLPGCESSVVVDNLRTIEEIIDNPKLARLNAQLARKHFLDIQVKESSKFWINYVRTEFAKGGGNFLNGLLAKKSNSLV